MKKILVIPVRIINNKIEMNLNEMIKDVFYPIKYKNKKYLIGSPKEGIIDIYKIKRRKKTLDVQRYRCAFCNAILN